jgi:hypothetical protein
MPEGRAGPLAVKVRTAAAWLALAFVSWQALVSVRDVASEQAKPLQEHLRVFRSNPEELIRRKLGKDFAMLEALRTHVPRDGRVLVSFVNDRANYPELRRVSTWIQALVYPMVIEGWPLEERVPGGKVSPEEYVLDLESGRDYSVWPLCKELASGPHFRLLLVGNEAR